LPEPKFSGVYESGFKDYNGLNDDEKIAEYSSILIHTTLCRDKLLSAGYHQNRIAVI